MTLDIPRAYNPNIPQLTSPLPHTGLNARNKWRDSLELGSRNLTTKTRRPCLFAEKLWLPLKRNTVIWRTRTRLLQMLVKVAHVFIMRDLQKLFLCRNPSLFFLISLFFRRKIWNIFNWKKIYFIHYYWWWIYTYFIIIT